jgi:hypothetical protein
MLVKFGFYIIIGEREREKVAAFNIPWIDP